MNNIKASANNPLPFISICIPARNEDRVIERCVTSALKQDYPNYEVLVLDDNSTDNTTQILEQLSGIIANLKHLKGTPKPDNWLGKPWACHQLSRAAKGDILVFIDADVWLEPNALIDTVSNIQNKDAITVWPQQKLISFWENMTVPLVYFALFTLLPAVYVERPPRWMPNFLHSTFNTKFVAACGQFFAFKRSSYDLINGHESVKEQVVEDMELAKNLKSNGLKLQMLHGLNSVYCRMYTSHQDIWNGFIKNFFAGFGSILEFIFMGIIHFLVFLFPIITLTIGFMNDQNQIIFLSLIIFVIIFIQRTLLSIRFKWNIIFGLLHPFSVLWFQILGVISIINKVFGIKTSWKGREV